MYVCLCHGFTEKQVRHATAKGPCTVSEVYRRLGETPQCGQCVGSVVDILRGQSAAEDCAAIA